MIFSCTKKVRDKLIKYHPITDDKAEPGLFNWYVDLIHIHRKQYFLFTHSTTLYTFWIYAGTIKQKKNIHTIFQTELIRSIHQDLDVDEFHRLAFLFDQKGYLLQKTNSRSILGSMTDIKLQMQWYADDRDLYEMKLSLNSMPISTLHFNTPIQEMKKLIYKDNTMDSLYYLNLRENYTELTTRIINSERKTNIVSAGKKLGFYHNDTLILDNDSQMNVLMDAVLYEKHDKTNGLIDRFYALYFYDLTENEQMLLNGMRNSIYSIYEILEINKDNHTLNLFDLIGKREYTLKDITLSQTAERGMLIAARLIPIEESHMTSGIIFAFESDKRLRLLTEISRIDRKKRRIGGKAKKINTISLYEIMYKSSKKWGMDVEMI